MPDFTSRLAVFTDASQQRKLAVGNGNVMWNPGGATYYPLAITGMMSVSHHPNVDETLLTYDPHGNVHGKVLHVRNDTSGWVDYNDELYLPTAETFDWENVDVTSADRHGVLLYRTQGGIVHVSASLHNGVYDTWRVFVGDGTTMRPVRMKSVAEEARSSGEVVAVYISTAELSVFVPPAPDTAFAYVFLPWWGDGAVSELNMDDYKITESYQGELTIREK